MADPGADEPVLTQLKSARARREVYGGQWLPEPVLGGDSMLGPEDTAQQRESVSTAMLVLMERLTPNERAVYVLRKAFAFAHGEIAEMLDITEVSSQQIFHRAKQHLATERARTEVDLAAARSVVEEFLAAATSGQTGGIDGPSGDDDDPPVIPPDPQMPEEYDPSEDIQEVLEEAWSAGDEIVDDLKKQYDPSTRSFMEQYLDASKYYRQLLGPVSPFMTFEDYCMQNGCDREGWTFYRDGAFWLTVNQTANEELISWAGGVTGGVAGTGVGALIGGAVGTVTLPIVGTIDLGTVGGIAGGAAGAGGGSLVGAAVAAEFNRDIRRRWQEEGWVD